MAHAALRAFAQRLSVAAFVLMAAPSATVSAQTPGWAETDRLVAVGDLHGDYDAFLHIMSEAGLIDSRGRWSGKKTVFVQMGDAVDRGAKSRDIVLALQRLQGEASRAGGKVIALIGNHEAMNVTGDLRYVPPAEYQNYVSRDSRALRERVFRAHKSELSASYRQANAEMSDADVKAKFFSECPLGYIEHRRAWSLEGEFGRWILSNPAVAVVGDNLLVHGGISAKYAVDSVAQLNDMVHAALRTTSTADAAILEDEAGPLWYRGLAAEGEMSVKDVGEILKAYSVKRIVIAHTPNLVGIKVLDQGRVILIDTGIAAAYGGVRSFLSIEGASIYAHDGSRVTELTSSEFRP